MLFVFKLDDDVKSLWIFLSFFLKLNKEVKLLLSSYLL